MSTPMRRCCPTCGQSIMPNDYLPPLKQKIVEALAERPRTAEELRKIIGTFSPRLDNPSNTTTIYTHLYQLRRRLLRSGLTIRNSGANKPYHLVQI